MTTIVYPAMRQRRRDPEVAAQIVNRFMPPAGPRLPAVPWQGLFLEPVYADGQPYDRDDEEVSGE